MRKTTNRRTRAESGYSLIELLIVIAIIGILAAMLIPNLLDAKERSKQRATVASLRNWGTAVSAYHSELGKFPPPGSNIVADIYGLVVPYAISAVDREDFWEHSIRYYSDEFSAYTLESYGKDGIDGLGVTPNTWNDYNLDLVLVDGIFVNAPS